MIACAGVSCIWQVVRPLVAPAAYQAFFKPPEFTQSIAHLDAQSPSFAWLIKRVLTFCGQACNGQAGSKWLDFGANEGKPTWLEYDLLATGRCELPPTVASYALTSANDFPERDPTDFRLEGLLWSTPASTPAPTSLPSQPQSPAVDADHSQSDALAQTLTHEPATVLPSSQAPEAQADAQSNGSAHQQRQEPAAIKGDKLQGLSTSAGPGTSAVASNASCNSQSSCAQSHLPPSGATEQKGPPLLAQNTSTHRKMGTGTFKSGSSPEFQPSPGAGPHDASSQQPGGNCPGQEASTRSDAGSDANGTGQAEDIAGPDTSQLDPTNVSVKSQSWTGAAAHSTAGPQEGSDLHRAGTLPDQEAMHSSAGWSDGPGSAGEGSGHEERQVAVVDPACQPDSVEAAGRDDGHLNASGSASSAGCGEWVVLDEQQGISFAHRHQRLVFTVKAPRACRCCPVVFSGAHGGLAGCATLC